MTYFGFLIRFIVVPLIIAGLLIRRDIRRNLTLPPALHYLPAWLTVLAHVLIAVIYTTPWDNYLVATRVWWYDPELVTGLTIGWVPIEEYTFFVLQPMLTGGWLLYLARRLSINKSLITHPQRLRVGSTLLMGLIWLGAVVMLAAGWQPGTYLGLELGWALPPLMLQLAFGADILWRHRRLVRWALIPPTLYLSLVDSLAIGAGTWTISPAQSLNIYLPGGLPLEEFIFFLLTNTLLVCGMILALACESKARLYAIDIRRAAIVKLQTK